MCRLYVSIDTPRGFIVSQSLKVDHVHLKVSNLHEAVKFYQSTLGFTVLEIDSGRDLAYLGPAESTPGKSSALLVLDQVDSDKKAYSTDRERREAGLYHFAILLPQRKYLASFLRHIQNNLDPQFYEGMADHAVSESIYLHDPDYNGIEVYRDRKPSEWKWTGEHKGTYGNRTLRCEQSFKPTWQRNVGRFSCTVLPLAMYIFMSLTS